MNLLLRLWNQPTWLKWIVYFGIVYILFLIKDAFAIGAAKDALGTLLGEACANAKRATNNEGMDRENFKTLKRMVNELRQATGA